MLFTPRSISTEVIKLCNRVVPQGLPVYVPVRPQDFSIERECFQNVEQMIKLNHGQMIYGWQIWERLHLFLEAEFHAIWLSPNGEFIDITPKDIPTKQILFLRDPSKIYEGTQTDNIRFPLTNDPLLTEYFRLWKLHFDAMNRGSLREHHGEVTLRGDDVTNYERMQEIEIIFAKKYTKRNDPCSCGSGLKIKKCTCGFGRLLGIQ